MATCTSFDVGWAGLTPVVESPSASECRRRRIMAALGLASGPVLRVNSQTLSRYYRYLSAHLPLPFTAHYPAPSSPREAAAFRCTVLELLDPAVHLGDGLDGIFCKTRKGRYEINLPLIELEVPEDSPTFQLIDDFWYWFWNWR